MPNAALLNPNPDASSVLSFFEAEEARLNALLETAQKLRHSDAAQGLAAALQAAELASTLSSPEGLAHALFAAGESMGSLGDYDASLQKFNEALHLYESVGNLAGQVQCLNAQGLTFLTRGALADALDVYEQSLVRCRELGDFSLECTLLEQIGNVYNNLDNLYMARQFYDEALLKQPQEEQLCSLILSLGCVHLLLGIKYQKAAELQKAEAEFDQAQDQVTEALEMTRTLGDRTLESVCLCNLANIALKKENGDAALAHVEQALTMVLEIGAQRLIGCYSVVKGEIQLRRGLTGEAIRLLESGLIVLQERHLKLNIAETHLLLSEAYEALRDFPQALAHYKQFHETDQEVKNEIAEQRTRTIALRFQVEKSCHEAEFQRLRSAELTEANQQLKLQSDLLERLSREDALTGLTNRRHLDVSLAERFERAKREDVTLSAALLDVDHFKKINDRFSHQIGDEVLKVIGRLLRELSRETDLPARYGGEEFVLILPNTPPEQGSKICERLRKAVEAHPWREIHPDLQVTISIGLESTGAEIRCPEELLHAADLHLYRAKQRGRNQVCTAFR